MFVPFAPITFAPQVRLPAIQFHPTARRFSALHKLSLSHYLFRLAPFPRHPPPPQPKDERESRAHTIEPKIDGKIDKTHVHIVKLPCTLARQMNILNCLPSIKLSVCWPSLQRPLCPSARRLCTPPSLGHPVQRKGALPLFTVASTFAAYFRFSVTLPFNFMAFCATLAVSRPFRVVFNGGDYTGLDSNGHMPCDKSARRMWRATNKLCTHISSP